MKRLYSLFLMFAICGVTFAQSSKVPTSATSGQNEDLIYTLEFGTITDSKPNTSPDTYVSRSGAYGITTSDYRDMGALHYWLGEHLKQAYRLQIDSTSTKAADYRLDCEIDNMYIVSWKYMDEQAIYKKNAQTKQMEKVGTRQIEKREGRLTVELTYILTDLNTQEQFTYSSYSSYSSNTMPTLSAIKDATKGVVPFINQHFPVYAQIASIDKASKKAFKRLHLNVGSKYRITEDTQFEVYLSNDMEKPIAKMKVKSVEGENSCLCDITNGGKAFKAAYDAGTQIVIRTH